MDILRDHNWVLSVGTFLPLAGVLVMLFIPKAEEQLQKAVALITALATLGVGVYTLTLFNYDRAGEMQFVAQTNWISVIKSTYYIGIDGISLTVGEVRGSEFCVNLIPETLARTNLGWIKAGWQTNIEIDPQTQAIVDTVERVLAARQPT